MIFQGYFYTKGSSEYTDASISHIHVTMAPCMSHQLTVASLPEGRALMLHFHQCSKSPLLIHHFGHICTLYKHSHLPIHSLTFKAFNLLNTKAEIWSPLCFFKHANSFSWNLWRQRRNCFGIYNLSHYDMT